MLTAEYRGSELTWWGIRLNRFSLEYYMDTEFDGRLIVDLVSTL
jgi:hypothetical protein